MIECLKRHVVCIILDAKNNVIGTGRNMCDPPKEYISSYGDQNFMEPVCHRKNTIATEENYDPNGCNSIHAEIAAIQSIKPSEHNPYKALVLGHEFVCFSCLEELGRAGVSDVHMIVEDRLVVAYVTPPFIT